ncbi:2Fe-2S iron-sulfur cluster-binding protein [Guggenheimella bovis]
MSENIQTFLISVGVISAIATFLALLLSIAQNTIGNYGEKEITINKDKVVKVDGGDTLLSGLIENDVFLPSACGGKGSCGYCKCKVVKGGGQILPTETGFISEEEQKEGYRLACQCKIKEDVEISVPEEILSLKQYHATVTDIYDATEIIKHITFTFKEGEEVHFKAGQYMQLLAPEYEGNDEEVYRAYSISSPPSFKNGVTLIIGYIPNGIATTYVHHFLKVGDEATLIGPFGDFFYQEDSTREMLLIGTGTGLAPLLSILRHMRDIGSTRKATLYTNARTPEDLYIKEELDELKKSLPGFDYVLALKPVPEGYEWNGPTGYATNAIKEKENLEEAEAYLCGSPRMLDGIVTMLKELGVPEERIYFDKFE